MLARWFAFPGGCLLAGLYVPDGKLVFALVPGGLRSGFVGRCFQARSSRNRMKQDFCVFKRKLFICSHLCLHQRIWDMKKHPLVPGKSGCGKYSLKFTEIYENRVVFQRAHGYFTAFMRQASFWRNVSANIRDYPQLTRHTPILSDLFY